MAQSIGGPRPDNRRTTLLSLISCSECGVSFLALGAQRTCSHACLRQARRKRIESKHVLTTKSRHRAELGSTAGKR
ncbi:hypothetical protein [Roseomonas sp. AR75]|uniref:hypothetical protein n=1 Tax=Roseomonas sp. AR75 TaxID=2562311 RepID=UPI0010C0F206|nr:hypothetical protein [Roseomonas sp. AR75]